MAQLRDSKTSEIVATGDPTQLALLAREIGFDQVIFDGVGDLFDPAATIADHQDRLAFALDRAAEHDRHWQNEHKRLAGIEQQARENVKDAEAIIVSARDGDADTIGHLVL